MKQALAMRNEETGVIPIEAADVKAWDLVNAVQGWMRDNACYNYSEAFRQLDVARASYYRAIKRPFVQAKMVERMQAADAATFRLIEEHWPGVVANMVHIAQGEGREAVQAARFVAGIKETVQERAEKQKPPEGKSQARLILEAFGGAMPGPKVVARRTVEEMEFSPDSKPEGMVIDG